MIGAMATPHGATETELATLLRAGHASAFVAIMRHNNQRLYRLARGVLRDEAEAEEVVQESYLRAFTHLDGFKGESTLATWLARIVLNEALGRLRRRRPTVAIDDVAETLAAGAPGPLSREEPSPEQAIARHEIRRSIEPRRDREDALSPRQQAAAPSFERAVRYGFRRRLPVPGGALRPPHRHRARTPRPA